MNAKTTTAETVALRDAKSRHLAVTTELQRIDQAVKPPPAVAEQEAAARAALEAATRTLEDTAAAHALGDAKDDDLAQARQAQAAAQAEAARIKQETAEEKGRAAAAAAGLARRLQVAREEAAAAAEALHEAEIAWLRAELVEADRAHCEAVYRLGAAFGRAKGLGRAIKQRGERYNAHLEVARQPNDIPMFGIASDHHEQHRAREKAFRVDFEQVEVEIRRAAQAIG